MSYVRAMLIGVALGLALVVVFSMVGCRKSSHNNTTVIEDPPIPVPTMECVIEDSGSVIVTIETAGVDGLVLAEAEETERQSIEADKAVILNLDSGQHTLQLIGPEDIVFAECILDIPVVDEDSDDGDEGDGFVVPPRPERCGIRFDVCHKGKTLRLPWAALEAHSKHAGDILGACEQQQ